MIPTDHTQLLDYFAGQVLASEVSYQCHRSSSEAATIAYDIAEAMLKERDKRRSTPPSRGSCQRDWDGNQNDR